MLHVGGPHGVLQVEPADVDHVVLVSGGIGVTPMVAILEDLLRKIRAGTFKGKVTFIWSTRTVSEINAFAYILGQCTGFGAVVDIRIHYTGALKSDKESGALPHLSPDIRAANNVTIKTGRILLEGDATLMPTVDKKATEKVGVFVCGPLALSMQAESFVNKSQSSGYHFYLHKETFEL